MTHMWRVGLSWIARASSAQMKDSNYSSVEEYTHTMECRVMSLYDAKAVGRGILSTHQVPICIRNSVIGVKSWHLYPGLSQELPDKV